MEGKRANRGGWWLILLSLVLVTVLAIAAAWRWAVAQEGTINGERASAYVDRMVELRRANPMAQIRASQAGVDLQLDARALVTLLKMVERRPTQLEALVEKLRVVLPAKIAAKLSGRSTSELRSGVALPLIIDAANRRRPDGSSLFLEALAVLSEGDVELLGQAAYTMSRATEKEDALVDSVADRLLLSREPKVMEFAVALKMKVFNPKVPPGSEWFKAVGQIVQSATNLPGAFMGLPDYLRRANVDDASAKSLLALLSKSRTEELRVVAKLETWRRFPGRESVAQRAKQLMEEDGEPGFVHAVGMLMSEPDSREAVPLDVAEELVARFHRAALSGPLTRSSPSSTVLSYYSAQFHQHNRRLRFNRSLGTTVVALVKPWAPQLQGQATNLLDALKDKYLLRNDRLAMADLLQSLPSEPPDVAGLLIQGLRDNSLALEALPLLGKYGSRITNDVPQAWTLLESSDFSERRSAAGFFKQATPSNPALLDRWIAGLRDPGIQAIAAEALGDYGPAASKAAPALAELVASDSSAAGLRELRLTSIASLRKIRPEYSVVSASLLKALNDKPGTRLHAELVSAATAAILDLAPPGHPDHEAAARAP